MTPPAVPVSATITPPGRVAVLDLARGAAILGTLGTNVWVFTAAGGPAGSLLPGDTLEAVLRAPFNGVSLALLSVLFGVGFELQHRAARRQGRTRPRRYPLRCALLVVEGVVHYVLVFEYDVLLGYGIVALLLTAVAGRARRVRRAVVAGAAVVHVAVIALLTALLVGDGAAAQALEGPVLAGADVVYTQGSWGDQVALRLAAWPVFRAELLLVVPLGVVLFALGGVLVRRDLFGDGPRAVRLRRRAAAVGLGAGLPVTVTLGLAGASWFPLQRYVIAPVVALGLLAALTEWVRRRHGTPSRALAGLGRVALSAYVAQNLLVATICYGWGFGLTAALATWSGPWRHLAVAALWIAVGAVVTVGAALWRRRFERGPLEAVVHRLVR